MVNGVSRKRSRSGPIIIINKISRTGVVPVYNDIVLCDLIDMGWFVKLVAPACSVSSARPVGCNKTRLILWGCRIETSRVDFRAFQTILPRYIKKNEKFG